MKKSHFIWILLFFPLYLSAQNPKYYQAMDKLESALNTLQTFPGEVNKSGWDNAYDVKRYFNILQNAEGKINTAIDLFDETIEEIEKKDFTCLDDTKKAKVNHIKGELRKLKGTLNSTIDDLYDLDLSEVSSRVFTIYKSPSNQGYKRIAVPEIQAYFRDSFRALKSLYNHLADLSRSETYFQIDTDTTIPKLQRLCE